jgi:hypothetical protein
VVDTQGAIMAIGVVVVVAVVAEAGEEVTGVEVAVAVHDLFYSVTLIQIYPLIDDTVGNGLGQRGCAQQRLWRHGVRSQGEAIPSGVDWRDGRTSSGSLILSSITAL